MFDRSVRRPHPRATRPALEALEGRLLLYASTGNLWSLPVRVTYSIMPDGAFIASSVNGPVTSNLQQALNANPNTPNWQSQIQAAAALWENFAGVNLVQVSDDGSAFGATGNQQGDARFGDIRIGGYAQSGGILAQALYPPPANGDTAAGDVFFNTTQAWSTAGASTPAGQQDLMTVAIHEFGHALGLGHSATEQAVMYAYYNGVKQSLNSDDTAGIQAIYGPQPADRYDSGGTNNNAYSRAVDLSGLLDSSTAQVAASNLTISSVMDADWFKVVVPANTSGTLTVREQTSGLSSLRPALTVYNASISQVGSQWGSTYGTDAVVTVPNVAPGQVYYIRALAANGGAGGAGAYALLVNLGSASQALVPPPVTVVASQPDQLGSTSSSAERIQIGDLATNGDTLTIGDLPRHDHPAPPTAGSGGGDLFIPLLMEATGGGGPGVPSPKAASARLRALDAALTAWSAAG